MLISYWNSDVCSSDLAVAGRDQRDLRAGAAALAVPVEKAAALLAVVGAGGVAVRPDEGAGVADLELDEGFLGRRAGLRRADLEGVVGAEVGLEVSGGSRS